MMNPLNFYKYLPHFLRRKFNEKLIIIESDDWGMERAITCESISWMKKKFGEKNLTRWSLDSLETSEDLNMLFDLLEIYKNKFEFSPVITANFITHNVDYSANETLKFIPLSESKNHKSENVIWLYKKGIENRYIFPQLHGYSHYNLQNLRKFFYSEEGKEAFRELFLAARSTIRGNLSFLQGELSIQNDEANKIKDANNEFKKCFGYFSKTIIPPTFIFDIELSEILRANNITMVQSSNRLITSQKKNYRFPYFQKRKKLYWSVRNARLDPHPDYKYYHEQCINSIRTAFNFNSPAVIDFHRVNFAGKYDPEYRSRTLKELKLLLDKIYIEWPEAKFINSQKLNDILWQQQTI